MKRMLPLLLGAAGLVFAASPGAAQAAAEAGSGLTVTAVVGEALGGEQRLVQSSSVDPGEAISTGRDSNCALLVDTDALVQMCAASRLSLARRADDGVRVVTVEAGEARVVLDPAARERIEIHTPAAIATLLGTVVYIRVDEETGETTITSADHELEVTSAVPGVAGSVRMRGGERVIMRPGEPPPSQPQRLVSNDFSQLGGCLVDFEVAALAAARVAFERGVTDRVAGVDVATADSLPRVGAGGGSAPPAIPPGEPLTGPLLDPDDKPPIAPQVESLPPIVEPPPGCGLAVCAPGPL